MKNVEQAYKTIQANGEKLIFKHLVKDSSGDYWEVENEVQPGDGPPMHTHLLQEEYLEVKSGRMGVQYDGKTEYLEAGQGYTFKPGVSHRFWSAGEEVLRCSGYVKPAYNFEYFLTELYRSMRENGGRPGLLDTAFLLTRYKSEFSMDEIPKPVQSILFPVLMFVGRLLGKFKHYEGAPEPIEVDERKKGNL